MTEIAEIDSAIQQLPHDEIRLVILRAFQYLEAHEPQSVEPEEFPTTSDKVPLWKKAAKAMENVPEEEWAKVPTDLAANFDYYQKQRQEEA